MGDNGKVHTQKLKFKADRPIVVPLGPFGTLRLWRIKNNTRELKIELPVGLKPFKAEDRAEENQPSVFSLNE